MIAVIINATTVIIGSLIGILFGKLIKVEQKTIIFISAGLITILVGLQMAWQGQQIVFMLLALLLGGLIGHALKLEDRILAFGHMIKRLLPPSEHHNTFAEGFLAASVLFCAGSMTILGSLKSGISGDHQIIIIKSVLDGFLAIVLAGSLGLGVAFSALVILIYQGALTLGAGLIEPFITPLMLSELSGVGGLMVVMIGLNMMDIKKIKTAEFLPALPLIILFAALYPYLEGLFKLFG